MKPALFLSWVVTAIACIWFGSVSYSVLHSSNPPSPGCLYCEREHTQQRGDEQSSAAISHSRPLGEIATSVRDSEKSVIQGENAEHNEYHRLQAAFDNRRIEPNWWQAYVAIVAVAVAIAQAVFFWIQLRKMDESLGDAKDTSKAELRAYVSASMKSISPFDTKRPPIFVFECINHGQTPAKDVEFRAFMGVAPDGAYEFPGLENVPWNARRMNLFPNANQTSEDRGEIPCNCQRIFSRPEIAQIRAGTHFMFIGLEIQYWDFITNSNHFTRNYYRVGGHPVALHLLTLEGSESVNITGLSEKEKAPRFSIIPGLSLIT